MTRITRLGTIAIVLLWASAASAATFGNVVVESWKGELPLQADGSLYLNNPFGDIEIIGVDGQTVAVAVQRVLRFADQQALIEARAMTVTQFNGDGRSRGFRNLMPPVRGRRWEATVNYSVRVPRGVDIRIESDSSERIRIVNVAGTVRVKNTNGTVVLENATGAINVDSANGNIVYDVAGKPRNDIQLSTINGDIIVAVPADATFRWVATSIANDPLTNLPTHGGRFVSNTYRGSVNSSRGPTFTTASLMGTTRVLRRGSSPLEARSVRLGNIAEADTRISPEIVPKTFQRQLVEENLAFSTSLGDVIVGQVRGSAKIETGGGRIDLGTVTGDCSVTSNGGPLNLGDITGALTARTDAGDIVANTVRSGGTLITGGGMIRVFYSGGLLNLRSGGGDIVVRLASAPVNAETRSGDISINMAGSMRHAGIEAKTMQGSVTLGLNSRFGADVDATVVTSNPDANGIRSDFAGLSVRQEQLSGGKVQIRAQGKINGGGERLVLYAEDGNILLNALPVLVAPR